MDEKMWKVIYMLVLMLYGGLNITTVTNNMNRRRETIFKTSNITMIVGSIFLCISILRCFFDKGTYLLFLLIGLALLHMSAILSGRQNYGKVNMSHHIVRAMVSIFILFAYYKISR